MLPLSLAASSRTYSDQVPFGFRPLNPDNVVPYGPPGAGLGKVSPVTKSVGLYVPELMAELSDSMETAASSKVRVTLLISLPPPVSDMRRTFCQPGPTKRTSRSSG